MDWQSPESWQKDGSSLSGIAMLKKGAWTTYYKAIEAHQGRSVEVVIKTFAVPEGVLDDPERIKGERERFLSQARLQYGLTHPEGGGNGAGHWVKVLRLSEDPQNPSFSMEKCGPSVQNLLDNKVQLGAKDLYELVQSILQGLIELKNAQKRSHGNIKPSDVLCALPGQQPPYKLSDPAPKGEEHSANDLYSLGLIVYQLVEHREWDPLVPITPTKPWGRFGGKRDRWIQFLSMLLNPNGCHEALTDVRKEAFRLKPSSPVKGMALAGVGILALVAVGAVGYHLVAKRFLQPAPEGAGKVAAGGGSGVQGQGTGGGAAGLGNAAGSGSTTGPGNGQAGVDPQVDAALRQAIQTYENMRAQWTAVVQTARYDHSKSRGLSREAFNMLPQPGSTPSASDVEAYIKASFKLQEAIRQVNAEEAEGKAADGAVFAEFEKAQGDYQKARGAWETAAAKFAADRDHSRSKTLAQAAVLAIGDMGNAAIPTDPAVAKLDAQQLKAAVGRLNEALALVPQEETAVAAGAGGTNTGPAGSGAAAPAVTEEVKATFEKARQGYEQMRDQWSAAANRQDLELTAARATAEEARTLLPDQIVLTDAASYRATADLYQKATAKLQEALGLVEEARKAAGSRQGMIAAALQAGNAALQGKKYSEALVLYRKAADLGNAAAMHNVGLLYETGQGTARDYGEAAAWYRKSAELAFGAAMYDLGFLYETGHGVERDYAQAAAWYRKAAAAKDAGHASIDAMNHLAYFYENGWGVPENFGEAMKWYRQAADLGDANAMNNVGVFYERGRGVKADPAEAMKWYRKAADLGNPAAMNGIGALYDGGKGVRVDYQEAMKWYRQAAEKNYAPAMCNIGVLYDNGLGTPVDHAEAMKWFQQAAGLGDGLSMYNVAFEYERGRGVAPDVVQAVQWYRRAYKSSDDNARQLAGEALDRMGYSRESTPPRGNR
jgi:TPR repeat protein